MSDLYLLVYAPTRFVNTELGAFLDNHPQITYWFFNMPNSMFIATHMTAKELSELLRNGFGHFRHFITPVAKSGSSYGYLPKDHWPLVKKYRS